MNFDVLKSKSPRILLNKNMNFNKNEAETKMENPIHSFFYYQGFLQRHWRFTGQRGRRGDHLLFHSNTSTRSQTFRHLFGTLHVRWLHVFLIATLMYFREKILPIFIFQTLIRSIKSLLLDVALYLYKSTIRTCMEYCCHIWAGAPSCNLKMLYKLLI